MRAVLDTNTLVSAVIVPKGKPAQIYEQATLRFDLVSSEFILHEVATVLPRPHIQKRYTALVTPKRQAQFLAHVRSLAMVVGVHTILHVVKEDNKDNQVLACALDGHADYLVTGDHHLLDVKTFRGIKIIEPSTFLDILNITTLRGSVTPRTKPENFKAMRRAFVDYLSTKQRS